MENVVCWVPSVSTNVSFLAETRVKTEDCEMSHVQNQHQEAAVILLCNQPCCGQTTEGVTDFNNELIIT